METPAQCVGDHYKVTENKMAIIAITLCGSIL